MTVIRDTERLWYGVRNEWDTVCRARNGIKRTLQGRADDRSGYQQARGTVSGDGKGSGSGVVGVNSDSKAPLSGAVTRRGRLSGNDSRGYELGTDCHGPVLRDGLGDKEHSSENGDRGATIWLGREKKRLTGIS